MIRMRSIFNVDWTSLETTSRVYFRHKIYPVSCFFSLAFSFYAIYCGLNHNVIKSEIAKMKFQLWRETEVFLHSIMCLWNKTVLLRYCKKRTAHRIATTPCPVRAGYHPVLSGGTPVLSCPGMGVGVATILSQGIPSPVQGTPPPPEKTEPWAGLVTGPWTGPRANRFEQTDKLKTLPSRRTMYTDSKQKVWSKLWNEHLFIKIICSRNISMKRL